MFRSQSLECPQLRCGSQLVAHYDDDVVVLLNGSSSG